MIASRIAKKVAKTVLPGFLTEKLRILRRLKGNGAHDPVAFDNTYTWLNYAFSLLIQNELCLRKPMYTLGVLQGSALANVLGIARVTVIEFGVAGGFGLRSLEAVATAVEELIEIDIDVVGFDTGVGL